MDDDPGAQPARFGQDIIVNDKNSFSEDEEAMYVAANDSDNDDAIKALENFELGNITVFRNLSGAGARSNETDDVSNNPTKGSLPAFQSLGWPAQQFIPQDDRTIILFDLNGVLVHHTFNGGKHKHVLRPGVEYLLQLLPRYRLGIYSSATEKTVQRAIAKLHSDLVAALQPGERPPVEGFFEIVLCRDHCVLAKEIGVRRRGGKPWDTIKPLGKYFKDLTQVILVDDSPHKSLPHEFGNMLVMPMWEGPYCEAGKNDSALIMLVNELINTKSVPVARGKTDVRPLVAVINLKLKENHGGQGGDGNAVPQPLHAAPPVPTRDTKNTQNIPIDDFGAMRLEETSTRLNKF